VKAVEELFAEIQGRLGFARFLGRRAIIELRGHLQDSVAEEMSRGLDEHAALELACHKIGTADELTQLVIDASWELKMIGFFKRHLLVTTGILAAPGVLLLGLSFLTFNFTCRETTHMYMGEVQTSRLCGVPALETVRPFISDVGFYGGPAWLQWSIHILSVIGPLLAVLFLLRSQLSYRRRATTEGTSAEIAFALDRKHILALAGALFIFLTVVAYKAAG
jgi:hypothetical protein